MRRLLLVSAALIAATPAIAQLNLNYISAGASQWALAVGTNTTLTAPGTAKCAQISVETANIRYTDDGTSASTTNGQIAYAGQQFQYCGALTLLKFTAISGSPTLNVSYYK